MKVYTQGSFDILHRGHINLLNKCNQIGTEVYISLLSDKAYTDYRGYPPAVSFEERKAVIRALSNSGIIIEGDNTKTKEEIEKIKPDLIIIGSDWIKKDLFAQYGIDKDYLFDRGISLMYIPYTKGVSSTQIKEGVK